MKLWHEMRSPGGSRPGGGPGVSDGGGSDGPGPQ